MNQYQPYQQQNGKSARMSRRFFQKKVVATVFSIVSFISVLISFVSPYWLVSWSRIHTPFDKLGLWEFCMDGYVHRRDENVQSFYGCWWIFAPYYDPIRNVLTPPWFRFIQLFVTLAFLIGLANVILMLVYTCDVITHVQQRVLLSRVLYYINIFIFCCLIIANIIFAFKHNDPYWMPIPSLNWPSWSFGLSCLATFFTGFAIIVLFSQQLADAVRLDDEQYNFPMSITASSHLSHGAAPANASVGAGVDSGFRRYAGERRGYGASSRPLKAHEEFGGDTTV
ncbi:hypothetical protein BOX15_Mlig014672g1 [Macrostomum lignano]|uniref:PMP-22/EMP/MP20/Claudin tight junction n=1 Tax=Macrostomum lignano TaxID=282301 RepID=A0A267FAE8_9PLAT|nr:hypothetical protein BOX15_Mlig014672g1 [Macrostomum lignano]